MALMTVAVISGTFAATSLAAANTTDTIAASDIGANGGVVVEILNGGGGSITVSVSDPGRTSAGNSPTIPAQTIAAAARGRVRVGSANVDPATGFATLTYSGVTSVTSQAFRY
jgi:hypothetical protein